MYNTNPQGTIYSDCDLVCSRYWDTKDGVFTYYFNNPMTEEPMSEHFSTYEIVVNMPGTDIIVRGSDAKKFKWVADGMRFHYNRFPGNGMLLHWLGAMFGRYAVEFEATDDFFVIDVDLDDVTRFFEE